MPETERVLGSAGSRRAARLGLHCLRPQVGDLLERVALVLGVALDGGYQIGNQVVPLLELDVDLRPRRLGAVAARHQPVEREPEPEHRQDEERDEDEDEPASDVTLPRIPDGRAGHQMIGRSSGPQAAQVDEGVAGPPPLQEAVDRRVDRQRRHLGRRRPGGGRGWSTSSEVIASKRSSATTAWKMTWTTCLRGAARPARSTRRPRSALPGGRRSDPHSSASSRRSACSMRLTLLHPSPRQQPVRLVPLRWLHSSTASPRRKSPATRIRGPVLTGRGPPRSRIRGQRARESGQLVDLPRLDRRHRHDHQLGDAIARLDPERLLGGRCCGAPPPALRGSRCRSARACSAP